MRITESEPKVQLIEQLALILFKCIYRNKEFSILNYLGNPILALIAVIFYVSCIWGEEKMDMHKIFFQIKEDSLLMKEIQGKRLQTLKKEI